MSCDGRSRSAVNAAPARAAVVNRAGCRIPRFFVWSPTCSRCSGARAAGCVKGQWYELPPCSVNLQQFPSVRYASGGDPVVLDGAELEVAVRLLLATLGADEYDLWSRYDHVGAMPIHSLALANNKV